MYGQARPEERADLWQGRSAGEARLKALEIPPRVLHLATHGFYRPSSRPGDRAMLLSGVALAGANRALVGDGEDGILYAIEAQGLNLDGTQLVVLSACETAQGEIDYGEGISGLVRALRTAGAGHVLVSLTPVSDLGAAQFMRRFYAYLLAPHYARDVAGAFHAARRETIAAAAKQDWADATWSQFVLVGP